MNINGNPCVGVFCKVSEGVAVVPTNLRKETVLSIEEAMDVDVFETSVCGSSLIGPLTAFNSNGMLVTDSVYNYEMKKIGEKINAAAISERFNAVGNNILVNDKAALVHPGLSKKTTKTIEEILAVEVMKGTIAGLKTVGSLAVATNKGILCHPKITEEEIEKIETLFGIPVSIGTVNYGMPYIGTGLVANTKGGITGVNTTGVELGRIEEALFL
ncbi:MAG: translation initiation factor IF-6 [Thermoplasmatales archaeon]|nr:translation initiation factor IF-6 [Thermoplasmatales archaeon]